jgi:hypothetical protein
MLKKLVKNVLARAGYTVLSTRGRYMQDGLVTLHNDGFRSRQDFQDAYRRGIAASNGVDPEFEWRVHVALWAASAALRVPGDFVECGVNAGFMSSAIMQRLEWNGLNRRFYLIDTFSGPVLDQYSQEEVERGRVSIARDAVARGAYVTDLERVRANYAEWPEAVIVQGPVPEVLSTVEIQRVAFLHIDMNCAYPERAALEFFWDSLSPGGIVLLDDYAYFGHDEQEKAMAEAARRLGTEILSIPTGQGLIIK